MKTMKKPGEKLKFLRESQNYTQDYVAEKLGVAQNAYSKLERGDTKFTMENIEKLAIIFDMEGPDLYAYLASESKISVHQIIKGKNFSLNGELNAENVNYNNYSNNDEIIKRIEKIEKSIEDIDKRKLDATI